MSRRHEREIARRLARVPAETPAAEPPAGLLERLRAEVPDDVGERLAGGEREEHGGAVVPFPARRWMAAAAMLVTLVGGGFLAWKLSQAVAPLDREVFDGAPAVQAPAAAERDEARELSTGAGAEEGEEPPQELERQAVRGRRQQIDEGEDLEADVLQEAAAARQDEPAAAAPLASDVPSPPAATPGALSVRVTSEDGGAMPGVDVRVEGGAVHEVAITDPAGAAEFPELPPGRYEVRGELSGFGTVVDQVEIGADDTAQKELRLQPAYAAEEIVVTGMMPEEASARAMAYLGADAADSAAPPAAVQRRLRHPAPPPPAPEPAKPAAEPDGPLMIGTEEDLQSDQEMGLLREALPPVHPEVSTAADRLSTFGLDVDTGSYTLLRAHLEAGQVPPPAAVRVEEVVNAQRYADPFAAAPARPGEVFRLLADGAPSPFAPGPEYRLVRFRVAARDLAAAERKPVALTLVVDVSGSMEGEKLELVRRGLEKLADSLRPDDRVALVVFSDQARLVAAHGEPAALRRAAARLTTEGGTNAEAGLVLGYETARAAFVPGATDRVMLLSDGVANIGATGPEAMLARVAKEAAAGIELTTVGVGMGEFNDALLETLADRGDGRYAYVDDRREIERLFSGQLDGTLQTVAEEARAQVEFEPRVVESWRQLGYENRAIADHEFRYDAVDAGEIGPGHSVTALYEVKLRAEPPPGRPLALLKLRWSEPAAADGTPGAWHESEQRLLPRDLAPSWDAASPDLRLAAVAAELAEQLRRSPHAASPPAALLAAARRLAGHPELADLAERWSRLAPAPESRRPEPAAPTPRP